MPQRYYATVMGPVRAWRNAIFDPLSLASIEQVAHSSPRENRLFSTCVAGGIGLSEPLQVLHLVTSVCAVSDIGIPSAPRHASMYAIRQVLDASLDYLGGVSHSIYATITSW